MMILFNEVVGGIIVDGDAAAALNAAVTVNLVPGHDDIVVVDAVPSDPFNAEGDAAAVSSLVTGDLVVGDRQAHSAGKSP